MREQEADPSAAAATAGAAGVAAAALVLQAAELAAAAAARPTLCILCFRAACCLPTALGPACPHSAKRRVMAGHDFRAPVSWAGFRELTEK